MLLFSFENSIVTHSNFLPERQSMRFMQVHKTRSARHPTMALLGQLALHRPSNRFEQLSRVKRSTCCRRNKKNPPSSCNKQVRSTKSTEAKQQADEKSLTGEQLTAAAVVPSWCYTTGWADVFAPGVAAAEAAEAAAEMGDAFVPDITGVAS